MKPEHQSQATTRAHESPTLAARGDPWPPFRED